MHACLAEGMGDADLVISDVRPWGGEARDLVVSGATIADVVAPGTGVADRVVHGRGLLALPGIVNAHAHVDKSWWGLPWQSWDGERGVAGRIAHERARRDELGIPGVEITAAVLGEMVRHGTTAIRTHVDVDLGLGLRGLEVVQEAAAAYDGALTVETVAFPQDGVLRRPGALELLDRAAAAGADHVGGLDPASIDRDPVGQLGGVLEIAARHGCGADLHLHDPAELGAFTIELLLERVASYGLAGAGDGRARLRGRRPGARTLPRPAAGDGRARHLDDHGRPRRPAAAVGGRARRGRGGAGARHRRHPRPLEPLRHR